MKLAHLHVHTRDRALAEQFYSEWFGMQVDRRGGPLTFMSDGAGFELALMDDDAPDRMPGWFHFGFKVASADEVVELYQRMLDASMPIAKRLFQDEELAAFRCADPDGYHIEVYWQSPGAVLS
jgi:catechol-2,3-dioxygenase